MARTQIMPNISCTVFLLVVCLAVVRRTCGQLSSSPSRLDIEIDEELPVGTRVADLVRDAHLTDLPTAGLQFDIISGNFRDYFRVGGDGGAYSSAGGLLIVNRSLDRDAICQRRLTCQGTLDIAVVSKATNYFRMLHVTVNLLDINDNAPSFQPSRLVLDVSEAATPGTVLMLPFAEDPDVGENGSVRFQFTANWSSTFEFRVVQGDVDADSAELRLVVVDRLDRETEEVYAGTVTAVDGGTPARTGRLDVIVRVLDVNDNSPKFEKTLYEATIREDLRVGSVVAQVRAFDRDAGLNGDVRYNFSRSTLATFGANFEIDHVTGNVVLRRGVVFRSGDNIWTLTIIASDRGPGSVPVSVRLVITVQDVNNHPPSIRIGDSGFSVDENQPPGALVGHVTVDDDDSGDGGTVDACELTDGAEFFSLSRLAAPHGSPTALYRLDTRQPLDRERRPEYPGTIACRDAGQPALSAERSFVVRVLDVNDNAPAFGQRSYAVNVRENGSVGAMPILRVWATDVDLGDNGVVAYSLHDSDATAARYVVVDPRSGMITAVAPFDYELTDRLEFVVVATDRGRPERLSSSVLVTVTIVDINDEAPQFLQPGGYSFGTYENQPGGTEIGSLTAVDRDGEPFNRFTYSLLDEDAGVADGGGGEEEDVEDASGLPWFAVDPDTGTISTVRPLDRERRPVHYLTAVVAELAHPHRSSTANVTVFVADRNDNSPVVAFPSGPDNDTAEVSVYAASGHVFARVVASDADVGANGRLRYAIVSGGGADGGNYSSSFDVDATTGAVSVRADLTSSLPSHVTRLSLTIVVRDHGDPERATTSMLNVVVNRSASAMQISSRRTFDQHPVGAENVQTAGEDGVDGGGGGGGLFSTGGALDFLHRELLILVAAGTALLVIVLITAIICIRRRQFIGGGDDDEIGPEVLDTNPDGVKSCGVEVGSGIKSSTLDGRGSGTTPVREPEFRIVRNIISERQSSPWKASTLQPPGSKLSTVCDGETTGCYYNDCRSTGPCSEPGCDDCRPTTLYTFSKLPLSLTSAAGTMTRGYNTLGGPCCRDVVRPSQHCCPHVDDRITQSPCCQLPSPRPVPVDTRQNEIKRLLELLRNDVVATRRDVVDHTCDDDDDDDELRSNDDNTSIECADSGLGPPSEHDEQHGRTDLHGRTLSESTSRRANDHRYPKTIVADEMTSAVTP